MIKISIITVVKNGMPFLEDAIKSFNSQNYENKEHIIVYSKSNDSTEEYLNSLTGKKIIKDNNSNNKFGPLNLAIKACSGDYIGILHADDFFSNSNTLSEVADFLHINKSDIIYGNIKFCEKDNINKITRVWNSSDFDRSKLKYGWMPPHTSIFAKKNILLNNFYSEDYSISGDYEFILKIFLNYNYKIKFFDKNLIVMRTGGVSTNIKLFFKKFKQDLLISKKFFNNYLICVIFKILRKINQFL
tara:strand:- start:32 stop:766 length:735 start_codon:yes stop_codon:yes gene_type:complete